MFGLLFFLLAGTPPAVERGLASSYSAWTSEWGMVRGRRVRFSWGKPYCMWTGKIKQGEPILAHRTLPCGTRVYVHRPGRPGVWAKVGDRGPWGACVRQEDLPPRAIWDHKKRCSRKGMVWYVKRRSDQPGEWEGVADLSHELRALIGHNGYQTVVLRYRAKKAKRM